MSTCNIISGVEIKELKTHGDERGFFRELIRETDEFFQAGFGQLSHSLVNEGILKAWHYHFKQHQWNYVATGLLRVVLYDYRKDSDTYGKYIEFLTGDGQKPLVYAFPVGVLHGYCCLEGPVNIFYVTSGVYDLEGDEARLPSDDPNIKYCWY